MIGNKIWKWLKNTVLGPSWSDSCSKTTNLRRKYCTPAVTGSVWIFYFSLRSRQIYLSLYLQCWTHIVWTPPNTLHNKLSGALNTLCLTSWTLTQAPTHYIKQTNSYKGLKHLRKSSNALVFPPQALWVFAGMYFTQSLKFTESWLEDKRSW